MGSEHCKLCVSTILMPEGPLLAVVPPLCCCPGEAREEGEAGCVLPVEARPLAVAAPATVVEEEEEEASCAGMSKLLSPILSSSSRVERSSKQSWTPEEGAGATTTVAPPEEELTTVVDAGREEELLQTGSAMEEGLQLLSACGWPPWVPPPFSWLDSFEPADWRRFPIDRFAKSFRDLEARPAAVSAGELRSPGEGSPPVQETWASPGDLGSSLTRTTDTWGEAVREDDEEDDEGAPTGVMVMALFRSRTLASESRGDPDPELVLLAMRCEGSRLFVDGGVPSRTLDSRRICCCCWKAAARAALAESSMITLGAGCGMICTPDASGGGRGSPLAVTDLQRDSEGKEEVSRLSLGTAQSNAQDTHPPLSGRSSFIHCDK